jgi:serine/threonine protein kinase
MMGGLTPVYAPPEVFEGRPSRKSDQYSLAIVFQEMLTGSLPFPGRTAAQLAAQHPTLSRDCRRCRTAIRRSSPGRSRAERSLWELPELVDA